MTGPAAALLIGTWLCKANAGKDPIVTYTITYRTDGTSTSTVGNVERDDTYSFSPTGNDAGLLRYTTRGIIIEFPTRVRWTSQNVMTFSDYAASTGSVKEPFATCVRSQSP